MNHLNDNVELFQGAKYNEYRYPDWQRYIRNNTDFGWKIYFSLSLEDAGRF